jgi:hypothetical protein
MKVIDLNGHHSTWSLTGCSAKAKLEHKSSYHLKARNLIKEIFPTLQILEEVPINIRRSETLYLDFYLPLKKMCIEVHGEQHYNFVKFYHATKLDFLKAQKRDKEKQEWCSINGINYSALKYDESIEEWSNKLNSI